MKNEKFLIRILLEIEIIFEFPYKYWKCTHLEVSDNSLKYWLIFFMIYQHFESFLLIIGLISVNPILPTRYLGHLLQHLSGFSDEMATMTRWQPGLPKNCRVDWAAPSISPSVEYCPLLPLQPLDKYIVTRSNIYQRWAYRYYT